MFARQPLDTARQLLGLSELDVKAELVVSSQGLDGDSVANAVLFHSR